LTNLIDQPRYVCALGAMQTVSSIERAVPILHAGPVCGAKLSLGMTEGNGGQGSGVHLVSYIPSSNISEKEVISGRKKT